MILQPPLVARAADDPNATHLPVFIATTTPFAILALFFYCARIYSRLAPSMRLYWDDYVITVGVIATFLTWGVAIGLESVTGSKHIEYISLANIEQGLKFFYIVLFTSYYANLLIKASVCVMILRIMQDRAWRISLWIMLGVLLGLGIAVTAINLMTCSSPSANWTLATHTFSCWSTEKVAVIAQVLGDFVLALLPIVFIRQLQRPMRDKIVLGMLMGCGLLATAVAILKMIYYQRNTHIVDLFYQGVWVGIFTLIELFLGIIACCAPCLKSLWDQMLRKLGIQISNHSSSQSEYLASRSIGGGKNSFVRSDPPGNPWGRKQMPNFSINSETPEAGDYEIPEKPVMPKETYESWETHARYGYAR